MMLEDITIDENLLKRLNPFKKRESYGPNINFDKLKEISELKKNLQKHLKNYINNVQKTPEKKSEFFDALGEELLSELSIIIGRIQQVLTQTNDSPIKEEIKDNSVIRNINSLFNDLLNIKKDTPLVTVEDILLHIYKKLKEHLDIKFPLDADYEDIDPDEEHVAHDKYEEKFFKNPSDNFYDFVNIDVINTNNDKYNTLKEKYRNHFNKLWDSKYKQEALTNNINDSVTQEINKEWTKKPLRDKTDYQEFKNKNLFDTYFKLWFNGILQLKFNKLWDKKFKKIWVDLHKKEREQTKSKLINLKECFNNIFKG